MPNENNSSTHPKTAVPADDEAFEHFVSDCDGAGIQYDGPSYEQGFLSGKVVGMDAAQAVEAQAPAAVAVPLIARSLAEWHEDDGAVAWWAWCGHSWAGEAPFIGMPCDSDWPGYHTHWTPAPSQPAGLNATPALPATENSSAGDQVEPDAWHQAILDACMATEACYVAGDAKASLDNLIDWHIDNERRDPAEVQAEPVAWRIFDGEGGFDFRCFQGNENFTQEWERRNPNHKGWVEALYTAPQAQPAPVQAEPVMIYHGRCTIDCGEHGHHDVEMLKMIPAGAKLYTAPQAQPADAPVAYLQEADQHLLHRFIQTIEDDDSFDIGKDAVKRLANLGVVENCGFGRYGVTMFGYWVHEHFWHQNPSLPLKTYADRDLERRAAMAAAQEGGNAATGKDGAA